MLAGGAVGGDPELMALVQICPRCRNAYRFGEIRGQTCATCMAEINAETRQDDAKTTLADDLVRGTTPNSRDSDT